MAVTDHKESFLYMPELAETIAKEVCITKRATEKMIHQPLE